MNYGCRKCRREGEKLLLKGDRCLGPKCAITKRPYAPGQHGSQINKKLSEYGRQLREKQRLKKIYGLSESTLKKYYNNSEKSKGNTTEQLVSLIELRLDNILYRANLSTSRSGSRQLVSHGKVLLNEHRVTIPSIILKEKDKISFAKDLKFDKISNQNLSWFKVDPKKGEILINHIPLREEVDINVNESLVVEFYSR
jgi:small subunit ribosomal protein S4